MSRQLRRSSTAKKSGSTSVQDLVSSVSSKVKQELGIRPWIPYVIVGIGVLLFAILPISHNNTKSSSSAREPDGEDMQMVSNIPSNGVRTERIGCREYNSGGQSCVYSGIVCVDVTQKGSLPLLYFVDDGRPDFLKVSTDNWCAYEPTADPRREQWPHRRVFAPRHSCIDGYWRTMSSVFHGWFTQPVVQWVNGITWLHMNNRLLSDTAWLLDTVLWQETLDQSATISSGIPKLFEPSKQIFVPHSEEEFERRTATDIDRLIFALMLRLNATKLYRNQSDVSSVTRSLFSAYPHLRDKFIFYNEQQRNSSLDLLCTRKIAIGPTLNELGDHHVCDTLKLNAWNLFGIDPPTAVQVGNYRYARPPSRLVFIRDRFSRVDELVAALRAAATHHRFELVITTVAAMNTAKLQVETFASAGVVLLAHGVHRTGVLWMPRHSAIVEVFQPGYTDFNVRSLANACNLWYHEIHAKIPHEHLDDYNEFCSNQVLVSGPEQCNYMNRYDIEVDVDQTMRLILTAYSKLGHTSA